MNHFVYAITAVEIMSILVCGILLCFCLFEKREEGKTRRDRLFVLMLVSCIVALAADALSWILDGNIRLLPLLYIATTLAIGMSFVLICEFIIYLTAYIRERQEITHLFEYIYMAFTAAAFVFVIVTSANGKLYSYENGVYADGPWYTAYIIMNIVAMLLSLLVFFTYRKALTRHDITATLPYIIFPCIAAAINAVVPEFSYAFPSVTLALVVVYIMLQRDEIKLGQMRERIMFEMSTTDILTKLNNRRAYENALTEAANCPGVGAIFCDVNGLKVTNDTLGHAAGDALLQSFAEVLRENFPAADIFRISGDEFVVLRLDEEKEAFAAAFERLQKAVAERNGIAAVGSAFGKGEEVLALVAEAEKEMYKAKRSFAVKSEE